MTTPTRRLPTNDPDVDRSSGLFIVFEGGEGAGKSSQVQRLAELLAGQGVPVTVTRQPGAGHIGTKIRALLLDPDTGAIDPRCEALLYAADRAEHVATTIRPALAAGHVVLCDRYIDSSVAYQGSGRGLDRHEITDLSMWASRGLVPDLTVLLDIAPEIGLARVDRGEYGTVDRIEAESLAFHRSVRNAFLDQAALAPERYVVVDARQTAEEVTVQITTAVFDAVSAAGLTPDSRAVSAHP